MIQLTDATVEVEDTPVPVMPDSVSFTEGMGEQSMRAASVGGGRIEAIYSNDLSMAFATVKFDMPATVELIEKAKKWKGAQNNSTITISGGSGGQKITRTFNRAALTADYEVNLGPDSVISIEFKSLAAI